MDYFKKNSHAERQCSGCVKAVRIKVILLNQFLIWDVAIIMITSKMEF